MTKGAYVSVPFAQGRPSCLRSDKASENIFHLHQSPVFAEGPAATTTNTPWLDKDGL